MQTLDVVDDPIETGQLPLFCDGGASRDGATKAAEPCAPPDREWEGSPL
jgi:hypothetical protein